MVAFGHLAIAQTPRTPGDIAPFLESQDLPQSRSDAHRLVGKVVAVDRTQGAVTLETDEGERVVKPTTVLLNAIRVGDTISVPRSGDAPIGASPPTR
jgi:hypothetical protein